jgi:hypothetical protein
MMISTLRQIRAGKRLAFFLLPLFFLFSDSLFAENADSLLFFCRKFDDLNKEIRDGKIEKENAKKKFTFLIKKIQKFSGKTPSVRAIFPLRGYTPKVIGGKNGEGYTAKSYDYFAGNKHGAHPAHDIFIYDLNQDSRDDNTKKPVDVLSIGDGVVISLTETWEQGSELRSGIVVVVFDTHRNGLFFYVHNSRLNVKLGQKVKAGDKIAEVGRTGKNAFAKRSPTHLHLMFLTINEKWLPVPENTFQMLKTAICFN